MADIEHVFVLMLENRSFDHFFGLSGRADIPKPASADFQPGATDRAPDDPPHEFDDVQAQIANGAMSGFDKSKGALLGFQPSQIPVISQLANEYVLFDNWYSSMPGPTWPNRFFVHTASSGGLATSPTSFQTSGAAILPSSPFRFQNGSIYDRLDQHNLPWRVYHGDVHPQVLAVPGMCKRYLSGGDEFRPIYPDGSLGVSDLVSDLHSGTYLPAYTFIEPNYALQVFSDFYYGDSQHPRGLVSAGEALIKYVYEAISTSPIWNKSALLVTWDEHGGFYDHCPPPAATPPGDTEYNRPHGDQDVQFAFDRLGVRVPALLISPLAPKGALGSQLFPNQHFDHSSVIKTVFQIFGLGNPLTARDAAAPSWDGCLSGTARAPNEQAPLVLQTATTPARLTQPAVGAPAAVTPNADVDGFLSGAGLIALDLDRTIAEQTGNQPIANFTPQPMDEYLQARAQSLSSGTFKTQLVQYVNEVGVRTQAHRLQNMQA